MNKFNFQAMTKHGFLIIPKTLLQQQIENPHLQEGEIEALLKILMKVNYSETLYNDMGGTARCRETEKESCQREVPTVLERIPQHHAASQGEHRQGATRVEEAE